MQDLCVWICFTEIIKEYGKAYVLHLFNLIVNNSSMHTCFVFMPPGETTDFSLVNCTYIALISKY